MTLGIHFWSHTNRGHPGLDIFYISVCMLFLYGQFPLLQCFINFSYQLLIFKGLENIRTSSALHYSFNDDLLTMGTYKNNRNIGRFFYLFA